MSLKARSVETQELLDLASLVIDGAAKDGGMIAADMEARRLLDAHPDCHISFEQLRESIAQLAVIRGVGVEFGLRPGQNSYAPRPGFIRWRLEREYRPARVGTGGRILGARNAHHNN
jgi:hypothetical protein